MAWNVLNKRIPTISWTNILIFQFNEKISSKMPKQKITAKALLYQDKYAGNGVIKKIIIKITLIKIRPPMRGISLKS